MQFTDPAFKSTTVFSICSPTDTSRYNGSSALNTEQPNSKMQFKSSIKEVQYDRGHLILRCKSYVYLYNFDPVSVAFELLIRCKGEAPFICARLSNDQSEMICLDLDHILRVIPLKKKGSAKTREMSLAEYFEGEENKWGQFVTLSSSDNLCLVATRSKLLLVDLVKMECRGCTDIKKMDLVVPCSSIGGVWKSDLCEITDSELIYLTTTHEVFAIKLLLDDVTKSWKGGKSLKKCVPFKVCIRWTHQFKSDPLVLKSTCLDETKEMLYLSSLVNNSTRVLLVEWSACALSKHKQVNGEDNEPQEEDESEEEPEPEPILSLHSYHPPFKPTDLATSHNTCLERGLLLETEYDMRTQINMSTVGLGIFQGNGMGGSITLLTMNSQGDIYHQKLTSTTKREEENGEEGESNRGEEKEGVFMEEMRRAQRTLMDRDKDDTLAVTETKNARSLFFDVIGPNDESECTKAEEKERRDRLKKMKRKWNWNRPIGKLKRYKDVLSQDLLDVWDVSESEGEAEMDEDDEDVRLSRFMAPADKVNFWLQSHQSPAVVGAAAVEEEEKPETALDWTVDDDVFCSTQRDGQEAAVEDTEVYLDLSGGPDKPTQKREVKKKTKRASGF